MTKIYNDLAADSGHMSALCLLDLTAAFDTVDYDLLTLRLERQFGPSTQYRRPTPVVLIVSV